MLRKILLVAMATILSYALTALGGYLVYTISAGRSETELSSLVRFVLNPVIAIAVGGLVGILSKNHAAWTAGVGLVAWALLVHGAGGPGILGWIPWATPVGVYITLGAAAGYFAWRVSQRAGNQGIRTGATAS